MSAEADKANATSEAEVGMAAPHEMTIPRSRGGTIILLVITTIVVFFVILATVNIFHGIAMIPSGIWLALVTWKVWEWLRREGGLRQALIGYVGAVIGRDFVETTSQDVQPGALRFGYELRGRRFVKRAIALDRIVEVCWDSGQGTAMGGRDMDDWSVFVWFNHDDPADGQQQQKSGRRPAQDIVDVGPARRREDTQAFGLSFIAFLREAGVELVRGKEETTFVRSRPST